MINRGAFTSPGLVEREWYKRYPTMYATLKEKYKVYKQQIEQQQKWMNRFQKEDKKIENEDDQDNETTKLLIKEEEKDEIKDDDDDNITFPDNFARPPRSHYCYELGSNVLRMDHFCVWFNNAVGFYNYKYFLLTIIYLLISCLLSIYILIYRILIKYYIENFQFGILNTICLLLTLIICIFFTVFAAMHSFMHLWQLSKNLTSIEYHKYVQIKSMATHFNISFPNTHEFDHGIFENCKKMLGYDLWFWCFPFAPSLSEDGYLFKYNQENKRKIEHVTKSIQSARQQLWKKSNLIK